ncbi:hypothetical protein Hanom_Chr10g00939311 [Helianthus anomalus]
MPEKALVGASMSLNWRMNSEEKLVYMEDGKTKIWREGGKMATIPKKADEELWYLRIVKNFVLPRDEDLTTQPETGAGELSNLGIGPEKKKRAPAATVAPKKERSGENSTFQSQKCGRGEESGKEKKTDAEAEGQAVKKVQKKKITRRGNLDAFIAKPVLGRKTKFSCSRGASSVVSEELPPSPPRAPINEQLESTDATDNEAEKTAGTENPEAEKLVDVAVDAEKITSSEAVDVGVGHPQTPEFVA